MKKLINILFGCLLAITLSVSVFADQNTVRVRDVEALPGETVYLTVSVTQPIKGRSMGIQYAFDEKVLKVLPNACSWEVNGMIKDFSQKDHNGVWAAGDAVELQGAVCVLAFEVLPKAKLTQTTVDCTLVIEDDGKTEYNASATVFARCDHQYGSWSEQTGELHSRECSECGKTESESHNWDDGTEILKDGKRMQVFTCSVCKAKRENALGETAKPTEGTKPRDEVERPDDTEKPTVPQKEEQHVHPEQQDSFIGVPVDQDREEEERIPSEPAGAGHSHQEDASGEEFTTEHTHTHPEETGGKNAGLTAIVVIAVCVILVGGAALYLKKKK